MKTEIYFTYANKQELLDIGADESSIYEDLETMEDPENKGLPLQQVELTEEQCHKLIPHGNYCYNRVNGQFKHCPFWDLIAQFPKQDNGYCHYLKRGDFQDKSLGLLWDSCKKCGVNEYNQDYE